RFSISAPAMLEESGEVGSVAGKEEGDRREAREPGESTPSIETGQQQTGGPEKKRAGEDEVARRDHVRARRRDRQDRRERSGQHEDPRVVSPTREEGHSEREEGQSSERLQPAEGRRRP